MLHPATGRLTSLGTLAVPVHDATGVMIGSRLFVFGGGSSSSTDLVQEFDPATRTGSVVGHLPVPLSDLGSAAVGGTIYLVGSLVLGGGFIWLAVRLQRRADRRSALRLYLFSLAYLALLFATMVADVKL